MKILTIILIFFISSKMFGQEKEKSKADLFESLVLIEVDKIVTACDCSDGMQKISSVMLDATQNFNSKSEIYADEFTKNIIDLSSIKIQEVAKRCNKQLGFNDVDIFDCPSFKILKENSAILNKKFRN